MNNWYVILSTSAFALSSGCGSETKPELTSGGWQASTAAAVPIAGYSHDLSRSHFKIGQGPSQELNTPTLQRWRGSLGAFAHDPTNNWSMAVLNANSPTGPYILDAETQNKMVKDYFVGAGLPADQIAAVATTFHYRGAIGNNASSAPVLDSLNSIVTRSIQGIPVEESVAWAKMTTAGDVDMETVFWPPIASSVVSQAVDLAANMADAARHSAYLTKLPRIFKERGVVIHHSDPSVHAAPIAYAAFDATIDAAGTAAMHHFDSSGVEFRLAHEQATGAGHR